MPKSGRYLPKNVSGDGWTPAWIAFAELRMPFVVSSVLKRSIATSSIITSAAAMPPADHALRIVRAAAYARGERPFDFRANIDPPHRPDRAAHKHRRPCSPAFG